MNAERLDPPLPDPPSLKFDSPAFVAFAEALIVEWCRIGRCGNDDLSVADIAEMYAGKDYEYSAAALESLNAEDFELGVDLELDFAPPLFTEVH